MLNKFKETIAVTEMHTSHSGAEGGGGGGGNLRYFTVVSL